MSAAVETRFGDDAARERIRTSLGESLIVEAAAGTGKTTELVGRIVAVLASGLTTVDRVVAVTFTRKAAGELKLRLRQTLDSARAQARGPSVTHLEDALARLEEARIGTIHSFCAEILRQRPVEAEIDPAFRELSEYEARRLYSQAFYAWFQHHLGASSPGLRRALVRLARPDFWDTRSPIERLQAAGRQLIEWRDFPTPWRQELFDRQGAIDHLVALARVLAALASQCSNPSDSLFKAVRPAMDLVAWVDRAGPDSLPDADTLEGLLVRLRTQVKTWNGRGKFADVVARQDVVELRDRLLADLQSFQMHSGADLAALLRAEMWDLVGRFEQIKLRAGGLDFVDLLIRARNLIRNDAEVRRYLQGRFTHLFIDEFQDTDPLQVEILLLLSADDPAQADWLEVRPIPGKLFLVGDPKQSIYRFRRADVVLYQQVSKALVDRGVGLVHLTRSFRAVPAIQQFINAAFEPEMQENNATGQPQYVPLEPHREPPRGRPSLVALPVGRPFGKRGAVTREAVGAALPATVAAFLEWLLSDSKWKIQDPEDPGGRIPIEPRHVCLLFRHFIWGKTDTTREFLRELEARGLAHVLVGARSFHQREEVETLRAALTAIEWPDDELSLFAALKGSLFAIPDAVLLRFRQAFGRLHPFRRLPEEIESDFRPLAEALGTLGKLHRGRNHRPIVATVHELLEATRAHAGFALRPAGNQVLANVYRVCDLARSFELGGGISFRGFVEELAAQAERPSQVETPALEEGADGVRVMTVHTAKGLEFPVVVLADLPARIARTDPDMCIDARRRLCAMPLVDCLPWDLLDHRHEEVERDRAEGVRVAYVAATRARDLLVVPAIGDEPLADSWLGPLNKALYPARARRRRSEPAPGCPRFGEATVLEGPDGPDGGAAFSIRPGLHAPERGDHPVVWWDPACLKLKAPAGFGLRQEDILAQDLGGEVASEGVRRYKQWKADRQSLIEAGERRRFDLLLASDAPDVPAEFAVAVEIEELDRPPDRPSGPRFGTLVHTALRDVALQASRGQVESVVLMHGRVLGAPPQEAAAAVEAVAAALAHPLLRRAAAAPRLHRELPLLCRLDDGRLLDGVLDLAFLEGDAWTIVDFKTDAHLRDRRPGYERQLQWYLCGLSRLTGLPARGWLLCV